MVGCVIKDVIVNNFVVCEDFYVIIKVWNDKLNKVSFLDSVKESLEKF